jgi:hypothetical protein
VEGTPRLGAECGGDFDRENGSEQAKSPTLAKTARMGHPTSKAERTSKAEANFKGKSQLQ